MAFKDLYMWEQDASLTAKLYTDMTHQHLKRGQR